MEKQAYSERELNVNTSAESPVSNGSSTNKSLANQSMREEWHHKVCHGPDLISPQLQHRAVHRHFISPLAEISDCQTSCSNHHGFPRHQCLEAAHCTCLSAVIEKSWATGFHVDSHLRSRLKSRVCCLCCQVEEPRKSFCHKQTVTWQIKHLERLLKIWGCFTSGRDGLGIHGSLVLFVL